MVIDVLLVDDHKIMREGLKSLLDRAEDVNIVDEADNGREAVQKYLEIRPDVVVMDLSMPVMGGIEATQQIVGADPDARVLALSMIQEKSFVMESMKSGAKGYLVKNCAAEELLAAIRTLAAGDAFICSKVAAFFIQDLFHTPYFNSDAASRNAKQVELTGREREVLKLISEGKSTKEIAFMYLVSVKTIDVHRNNIMKKLGLKNIAGLTKYAVREGLTSID